MISFLDRLMGRAPAAADGAPQLEAPQSLVVPPTAPFVHHDALRGADLRKGMWAVTKDGDVGIITGCRIDAMAEVTLIKPDGSTRMMLDENDKAIPHVVLSELADLRPAYIEEIPASRHEGEEHLRSFGYIKQSEAR